jgi:RecA-family ATPase
MERELKALKLIGMGDVQPATITWLWYPYIAKGRITLVEGDPGVGKSWFTLAIAAAVSSGQMLPGVERQLPKGKVLLLSGEDGLSDTVAPRLKSLGADPSRISILVEPVTLDETGILRLEAAIDRLNAVVCIIDPMQLFMGGTIDMNRANEVRQFMSGLHNMAERTGAAVVLVRHMRKAGGGKAIYAGLGSIDFSAAVRSVMQVERGDDGNRFVTHVKCNIAPEGKVITYTIADKTIVWGPLRDAKPTRSHKRSEPIREFLKAQLANGPALSAMVEASGKEAGFTYAQLHFNKEKLGIYSFRKNGAWWWALEERDSATGHTREKPRVKPSEFFAETGDRDF